MKNLLIIFLFLTSNIVWGQNIIQNGSFESFMNCPIHISQNNFTPLNDVNFWNSPTNSTPDFFHKCCYVWNWSQPKNVNGWQQPRSGKTYAGLFQLAIDTPIFYYKEYVKNTLSQNLQQNTLYNIRFFISYSCSYCSSGPYNAVVTDSIACYFSDTSVFFNISGNMPVTPQLYDTTGFYTDTLNWIEIRFQYIAQGWENYITIGDFKPYDSLANYQVFHNNGHNNGASYLYIDDVAIWMADTIPPTADAGNDTTICIGGKALLGTHNYSDYYYEWFPTTGLIYDTVGQTYASPNITTKYYLRTTDFTYEKTLDSVTVYVVNCGQNDTTVCIEQSFLLGSTSNPNWNYKWSPPTYLNYDTIGQPLC
ncbi:MAG: hypothetical protein K9J13_16560, partial [Saprospiraceae bacterium]|nr:hypothetical protein [Saprospiraceae bacterium]